MLDSLLEEHPLPWERISIDTGYCGYSSYEDRLKDANGGIFNLSDWHEEIIDFLNDIWERNEEADNN